MTLANNVTPIEDETVFDERLRNLIEQLEGNKPLPYYDTAVPPKPSISIEAKGARSIFSRLLFVLFGLILIFSINQSAYSSESIVNSMIDNDFIAWSNSIPKEEAEIQFRDFLSSFDSWDEAKEWLISKGFEVTMKSRLLIKKERERYNNHPRVFGNSVLWNTDNLGIVFANGWFHKLVSEIFVYGVSVGIHCTENGEFTVYSVNVTELAL